MKNSWYKKSLVVGIIILFIGVNSFSSAVNISIINIKKASCSLNGTIWYVGGVGPGNYSSIQEAINNASAGDTIFVYNGTYGENLVINKLINLIGENNTHTINNANIKIYTEGVYINNFTIRHGLEITDTRNVIISNNKFSGWSNPLLNIRNSFDCIIVENVLESNEYLLDGIWLSGSNTTITRNKILNNGYGIRLWSGYHTICNNIFSNNVMGGIVAPNSVYHSNISNNFIQKVGVNGCGLEFRFAYNNIICNNVIIKTGCGIFLHTGPENNLISGNIIHENDVGIELLGCDFTNISGNSFEDNKNYGLKIYDSFNTSISKNNFIGNEVNAYFRVWNVFYGWTTDLEMLKGIATDNYKFDSNYWGMVPEPPIEISGKIIISRHLYEDEYPWSVFDYNPMERPYNITGVENIPPEKPDINGPVNGKTRTNHTYTAITNDLDGDNVSFFFYWGDGTDSGWTEFVSSGTPVDLSHSWFRRGTYTIKVKAKDVYGREGEWAELEVNMPRDKATNNMLLLRLLERLPLLQKLLLLIN